MAVDLETLEIKIEASASGAAKSLDDLAKSLQNVKGALKGANKTASDIEKVGQAAGNAAKGVSKAKTETKNTEKTFDSAAGSAKRFSMSLSDITKATGKVESGIKGIFGGLKTGSATSFLGGITNLGKVFGRIGAEAGNGGAATAMSEAGKAAGEAGAAAGEAGEAAGASAGGWQAVVAVVGVKLVQALGKAFLQYQKLKFAIATAPLKALVGKIGEINGKLGQLFSSLKRIAMYRILRTILKEIGEGFSTGLENAYYFSQVTGGSLAKSLDLISTEFLYLKNSIGAAVAPLINALAPAVEYVVDKFVGLLNVVNQFLSALGIGGKWIKAVKYPAKYGDALDKATGSAKELKRTILGIDELNPLDSNNDKGKGKSGYSASDYASMFEYEEIAPGISDFAGQLKSMIKGGKWDEAGALLAEKINSVIKTADGKIRWENGIGEKITKFLKNITTAFNSFIANFDGKSFGELIGDAIQTAFNTIDELVGDINWETLGATITDILDGLFERVDGEKIGKTIHNTISSVIGTLTTIFTGLANNEEFKKDVSGFVSGLDVGGLLVDFKKLFVSVKEALKPIIKEAFKGIGKSIWNAIWDDLVITSIGDYADTKWQIGEDLSDAIKKIFKTIKTTWDAEWAALWYLIASSWNSLMENLARLAFKSDLTAPLGVLFSSMEFDLGQTGIGKAAEQTKNIYDTLVGNFKQIGIGMAGGVEEGLNSDKNVGIKFAQNTEKNVNDNLDGNGDGTNYNSNFQKGLTSSKGLAGAAKIFNANLNSSLNPTGQGEAGGGQYKTGVANRLKQGFNGKTFTSVGPSLTNALNLDDAGELGGSTYRTSLKDRLLAAFKVLTFTLFGTNLNNGLNLTRAGDTGAGMYKGGLIGTLNTGGFTVKKLSEFRTNLNTATDLGSSGKTGGDNYRTGVKTELGRKMAKSGFETLRTNLNAATNLGSSGKTGGGDYRTAFETALAAGLTPAEAEQVAKYATAISTNINTDGKKTRGATTASKFTTDFFNKIETNAGTTGTTFGSSVKENILSKNGIDPSGINSKTRSTLLDKFKEGTSVGKSLGGAINTNIKSKINPSGINSSTKTTLVDKFGERTDIGKTFGTKVGKNISDGVKDGLRKRPVTISLNLPNYTTGGGGKYSATMQVMASGGVLDYPGQLFIANEAGPELIGNIGRKTAVANTTQMVDAMAQGVYQANAESNMLLRQIIQYAAEIAAKEYASGGEVTVESITSAMTRNNRRLGKTVVAVGA